METRWLARIVGLVIAAAAIGGAVLLWLTVGMDMPINTPTPVEEVFLGNWDVYVDRSRPPISVFWSAVAIALLSASSVALIERWAARKARLSRDPAVTPLAPIIAMAKRDVTPGRIRITVLVPAHNEEDALPVTLPALLAQDRAPDRVIVVADNCTDGTVAVAAAHGVESFSTTGNTRKKAGALNQVLATLLPTAQAHDVFMIMDADTALDDGFITAAEDAFTADPALMAVGGIFHGEEGHGLLGQFQRNEYIRYSRTINRRRGRVFVLTGTSSLFRPDALAAVAAARNVTIPGVHADVYDTVALTEDNELTIALKSLGAAMTSPPGCRVVTELMPTWRHLWTQRMRWQRGALENIGAYGITTATARYWAQQAGIGYSVIALYSYIALMIVTVLAADTWIWFPFWLVIGAVFVLERIVTAWSGGWRARLLAATLFPELAYDMYLNAVFIKGIADISFARRSKWGHVTHGDAPEDEA